MAAWTGGPCPDCGEDVPANMLRCMTCRAWLNPDLKRPEPPVPRFFPLPEVEARDGAPPAPAAGHYVVCPACTRELRVGDRYVSQAVNCRFCDERFELSFGEDGLRRLGVFVQCPHCGDELRAAEKYLGREVICKHCDGRLLLGG